VYRFIRAKRLPRAISSNNDGQYYRQVVHTRPPPRAAVRNTPTRRYSGFRESSFIEGPRLYPDAAYHLVPHLHGGFSKISKTVNSSSGTVVVRTSLYPCRGINASKTPSGYISRTDRFCNCKPTVFDTGNSCNIGPY